MTENQRIWEVLTQSGGVRWVEVKSSHGLCVKVVCFSYSLLNQRLQDLLQPASNQPAPLKVWVIIY